MKKLSFLLVAALLLAVAAGCRQTEPAVPAPPPEEETPLRLETLAIEVSRGGQDAQELMVAVRELPELFTGYFAGTDVEIAEITVTAGASPADTMQALEEGSVHLAFLPAEGFLSGAGSAVPLFADACASAEGTLQTGTRALICAAPSTYGGQLAGRAASGKPLSWAELENARWGVLEADPGSRSFDLWLMDEYDGKRVADLPSVTVYGDYEALFRAAAAEEIDALVLRDDMREGVADAWTRKEAQTGSTVTHGMGRETEIWEELPVLEVTERVYSQLAVIAPEVPELADERFISALAQVLEQLAENAPEQMSVLGAPRFGAVSGGQLDATRRLVELAER